MARVRGARKSTIQRPRRACRAAFGSSSSQPSCSRLGAFHDQPVSRCRSDDDPEYAQCPRLSKWSAQLLPARFDASMLASCLGQGVCPLPRTLQPARTIAAKKMPFIFTPSLCEACCQLALGSRASEALRQAWRVATARASFASLGEKFGHANGTKSPGCIQKKSLVVVSPLCRCVEHTPL